MKNKKNYFAVLCIAILLFVAYMVPTGITILEDRHLQSKSKKFEIEKITLNTDEADLEGKLTAIQEVLQENVVITESQEKFSQEQIDFRKQVEDCLGVLDDNIGTDFEKSVASQMAFMDTAANKVYSLWKYIFVDSSAQEHIFWIDAETEKVLAFEIPFFSKEINEEECYKMVHGLATYYGYTGSAIDDKVSVLLTEKYSETAIRFYNEVEGTEVMLMLYRSGEYLSFNMYPSRVSVYDASSESN